MFLWPWLIGFTVLGAFPIVFSALLSLTDASDVAEVPSYVGLKNYEKLLTFEQGPPTSDDRPLPRVWPFEGTPRDATFHHALYNSLYFTLWAVPLELIFSLSVAHLLHRRFRGATLARTIVYLPYLLGGVATLVIWSWLLNPRFGGINALIRAVHAAIDPLVRLVHAPGAAEWPVPDWLYSPAACKPALLLIHVWSAGGASLIFLAGLRRIPTELHEAAQLDGAGPWRRFRSITLPLLTPLIRFNLIIGVVYAMQGFTESYLLQNRAQKDGLLFVVHYLYQVAFEAPCRAGYASAIGCVLMGTLTLMVVPLLVGAGRIGHEER